MEGNAEQLLLYFGEARRDVLILSNDAQIGDHFACGLVFLDDEVSLRVLESKEAAARVQIGLVSFLRSRDLDFLLKIKRMKEEKTYNLRIGRMRPVQTAGNEDVRDETHSESSSVYFRAVVEIFEK